MHFLSAVDLTYGVVYCFLCADYVHDELLEKILREEKAKAWKSYGMYKIPALKEPLSNICAALFQTILLEPFDWFNFEIDMSCYKKAKNWVA